jgi:hypothetical protein
MLTSQCTLNVDSFVPEYGYRREHADRFARLMAAMHDLNLPVDRSLVGPWSEVKVFVVHVLHPLGSYIMDVSGRITLCNVGFGDD